MYAEADDTVARRGAEHGVAATEYIGVVIVVAVLVAALVSAVTPGVPAAVVDGITGAVGQMVDGEAPGATARPAPTGRDLAATDRPAANEATMTVMGHSYGATALGHDAGRVWGVRHDKDPIALAWMHGRNPDAPAFGANGFTVGDGDVERRWWPYQIAFHGIYLVGEVSRRNLALVTLGRGDEVDGFREGR